MKRLPTSPGHSGVLSSLRAALTCAAVTGLLWLTGCAAISAPPAQPTRWTLSDLIEPKELSAMTQRATQPINLNVPIISFTGLSNGLTQIRLTEGFDSEVPKISGLGEVGALIAGGIMNCAVHAYGQRVLKTPRMALVVSKDKPVDDRTQIIAYLPSTGTKVGLELQLHGSSYSVSGQVIDVRSPYRPQCRA